MAPMCGTVTFFRGPADSPTCSPSDKAEVAVAAANIKAAALDADVAAVVAVAVIRAAAVIKDVADTNTAGKAVGAKVHTIKGTKAPTTYQDNAGSCNQGGGGWSNNGWSNNVSYPPSVQPESQNTQSFHNVPVPGTVMVLMQMVRGAQAPGNITRRRPERSQWPDLRRHGKQLQ